MFNENILQNGPFSFIQLHFMSIFSVKSAIEVDIIFDHSTFGLSFYIGFQLNLLYQR